MGRQLTIKQHGADLRLSGALLTQCGIIFDAPLDWDEYRAVGELIDHHQRASHWWIGDWYNYGTDRPQWNDEMENLHMVFGLEYSTLQKISRVARAFPMHRRHANLSWQHHAEIYALPAAEQDKLLKQADPMGADTKPALSTRDLRQEVREARNKAKGKITSTSKRRGEKAEGESSGVLRSPSAPATAEVAGGNDGQDLDAYMKQGNRELSSLVETRIAQLVRIFEAKRKKQRHDRRYCFYAEVNEALNHLIDAWRDWQKADG